MLLFRRNIILLGIFVVEKEDFEIANLVTMSTCIPEGKSGIISCFDANSKTRFFLQNGPSYQFSFDVIQLGFQVIQMGKHNVWIDRFESQ